eukprot:8954130-Pyramimonas_sp.AAC.1
MSGGLRCDLHHLREGVLPEDGLVVVALGSGVRGGVEQALRRRLSDVEVADHEVVAVVRAEGRTLSSCLPRSSEALSVRVAEV